MATGPDDAPQHHVLRALTSARQSLTSVHDAVCWSLSDDETRAALVEATRLQAVVRAAYLKLLAESARRDVPRTGATDTAETGATDTEPAKGSAETCGWLAAQCTMSAGRVRADLREATALDPDTGALRAMGAALSTSAVTTEHAAIAVRTLGHLPAKVVRERRDDVDTC